MNFTGDHCRCCFSSERLETLFGPVLEVYTLMCDTQALNDEDVQIATCLQCCEFLTEVHRFRIKCRTVNQIFLNNLEIKPHEVELLLGNVINKKSPDGDIKTEDHDELDRINQIDIQINKVEVDFNLESSQEFPPSTSVSNIVNIDNLENRQDEQILQPERLEKTDPIIRKNKRRRRIAKQICKSLNKKHFTKVLLECDDCSFKCKRKDHMIAHQFLHINRGSTDKTNRTPETDVDSKHKSRSFQCSLCPFNTTTPYQLRRHNKRKHSDEKPYKCDQCDYGGKLPSDLTYHKRVHLKDSDKPHKCTDCSFATVTFTRLKTHILRKHYDLKVLGCGQCSHSEDK